jgi:hypothetical protein
MLDGGQSKAIYFSGSAREAISDISGLPPSTELLRLDANNLYLTGEKLNINTELEIYQEYSGQCSSIDIETAGSRVGFDYTFRLNLEDEDENILVKDWYIMASKYFLTQEEYNRQLESEQGILGYFTTEKLQEIDEWRLQGYAGIIPDLAMGKSRKLQTRVVSPEDSTQLTEDQYRQQLKNRGYSDSQINDAISDYIDEHGSFYYVDLSQYSNKFIGINDASLSITEYTYSAESYWSNNIDDFTITFDKMKFDSFTIAQSDLSVGDLERFGLQANNIIDREVTGLNLNLEEDTHAFLIDMTGIASSSIQEVKLKLKVNFKINESELKPSSGIIGVSLYSDLSNSPYEKLVDGGVIKFIDLTDSYQEINIDLVFVLQKNIKYWLVLDKNDNPSNGMIQIEAGNAFGNNLYYKCKSRSNDHYYSSVVATSVSGFNYDDFSISTNSMTLLTPLIYLDDVQLNAGDRILIKDCVDKQYNGIYFYYDSMHLIRTIDANTSDSFMGNFFMQVIAGTLNRNKIFKYIAPVEFILNQNEINFDLFLDDQWIQDATYNNKNIWLKVSGTSPIILASFNRDDALILSLLAGPNRKRQINSEAGYIVDSFWNFTIRKFDIPQNITLYPRAYNDSGTWKYVPTNRDIHVLVRMTRQNRIISLYHLIPSGTVEPFLLTSEPIDGIVYMSIAKGTDLMSVVASSNSINDIKFQSFTNNTIITSENITQLDGVELEDNNRVLIQHLVDNFGGQNAKYNGVYIYHFKNAPPYECFVRADDMNDSSQLYEGMAVRILDGSVDFKNKYFELQTNPIGEFPIILNYTSLNFNEAFSPMPNRLAFPNYGAYLGDRLIIRSN